MLTTSQRGAIAESAVVHAALKLGICVLQPLVPQRYDFMFDLGTQQLRVQVKSAVRRGETVVIRCRSSRRTRGGQIACPYTAEEIDAIAAHCAELERCYLLPIERFTQTSSVQLRLSPARNNQKLRIHQADAYEFEATLGNRLGP